MLTSRPLLKQSVILLYQIKVVSLRDISWTQIKSLPETLWEFWHKDMTECIRRCVLFKNDNELCPPYCWCLFSALYIVCEIWLFYFEHAHKVSQVDRKFVPKLNCQRMVSNGGVHWVMSVVRRLEAADCLASAFSLLLILMSRVLQL